jgi:hypothetical protein
MTVSPWDGRKSQNHAHDIVSKNMLLGTLMWDWATWSNSPSTLAEVGCCLTLKLRFICQLNNLLYARLFNILFESMKYNIMKWNKIKSSRYRINLLFNCLNILWWSGTNFIFHHLPSNLKETKLKLSSIWWNSFHCISFHFIPLSILKFKQ